MNACVSCYLVAAILVCGSTPGSCQQPPPAPSKALRLDVVVAPKSGVPLAGLQANDFILIDNGIPQPITAFQAVSSAQQSAKVIVIIDAVNTNFDRVAYARDQVLKFLTANGGRLANPTTIAVLTDKGTQIEKTFSSDGNILSARLKSYDTGLRQISSSSGIWGANERVQISLTAVQQLTAYAATVPGRKIVIWVSPGWPLLSGNRFDIGSAQQRQIFASVIAFSKELQTSALTFYNVNPLGPDESLLQADFYEGFLNGVSKASQTDLADLSLQVLAIQSGGLSLNGTNDVAKNIEKCLWDLQSWYEITFQRQETEQRNAYHHVRVTVHQSGLTARTRDGYYAQP